MYYKEKKKIANFRITMGILFVVLGVIFAFTPLGQLEGGIVSPAVKMLFGLIGIILGVLLILMGVMLLFHIGAFGPTDEETELTSKAEVSESEEKI